MMDLPNFPTRLMDQSFGLCITSDDVIMSSPSILSPNYYRPWKWFLQDDSKEFCSVIDNEKNKFQVTLDVQHFKPSELNVKIMNKEIYIEGKHEERQDEHGFVSRQFTRRYKMPEDCNFEDVDANLSSDGVLKIFASKKSRMTKDERSVPIKFCESYSKMEKNKSELVTDTMKQVCTENDYKISKETKALEEMAKNSSLIKNEVKKDEIKNKSLIEEKRTSPSYVDDLIMESKKKIDELFKITGGTASSANADGSLKISMTEKFGESMSMSEDSCQKSSEMMAETSCKTTTAELSSMSTTETSSFSSMTSETLKSQESAAAFMSSSIKSSAISDKNETLSEKITEALKDAVENL